MAYAGVFARDERGNKHVQIDMGGEDMHIACNKKIKHNGPNLLLYYYLNTDTSKDDSNKLMYYVDSKKDPRINPKDLMQHYTDNKNHYKCGKTHRAKLKRHKFVKLLPTHQIMGSCSKKQVTYHQEVDRNFSHLPFIAIQKELTDKKKVKHFELSGCAVLSTNFTKKHEQQSSDGLVCFTSSPTAAVYTEIKVESVATTESTGTDGNTGIASTSN